MGGFLTHAVFLVHFLCWPALPPPLHPRHSPLEPIVFTPAPPVKSGNSLACAMFIRKLLRTPTSMSTPIPLCACIYLPLCVTCMKCYWKMFSCKNGIILSLPVFIVVSPHHSVITLYINWQRSRARVTAACCHKMYARPVYSTPVKLLLWTSRFMWPLPKPVCLWDTVSDVGC